MRKTLILALAIVFVAGVAMVAATESPPAMTSSSAIIAVNTEIGTSTVTCNTVANQLLVVAATTKEMFGGVIDTNFALCPAHVIDSTAQNEALTAIEFANSAPTQKGWIRSAYGRIATAPMTSPTAAIDRRYVLEPTTPIPSQRV